MKKTLCLLIFIILISCNKNNQDSIFQKINIENSTQVSIPPEMNTEVEYKENYINFSVGNISVNVPNDYAVTYWIEGEIVDLNNLDTTKLKYNKTFSIY